MKSILAKCFRNSSLRLLGKSTLTQNFLTRSLIPIAGNPNIMKRSFSTGTDSMMFHRHKMSIDCFKRTSTRFTIPPENIEKDIIPNFVGKIGVAHDQILYYRANRPNLHAPASEVLTTNSPAASWLRIKIPFSENSSLGNDLVRSTRNEIRPGRLLELMDFCAGRICYKHCNNVNRDKGNTVVTAAVDGVEFYTSEHSIDEDLIIDGYLTYTGKSSMEVRLDVMNSKEQLIISAYYVFVSRCNKTHKSFPVPQLDWEGEWEPEKCSLRYELGKENQASRVEKSKSSLANTAPNSAESQHLHQIFLTKVHDDLVDANSIDLGMTRVEKTM